MNGSLLQKIVWVGIAGAFSLAQGFAAAGTLNKTIRVEHGRPVVIVTQKSVLLLEFLREPIADALVPHQDPDVRHCRARYRFKVFHSAEGVITNGLGTVEEILQTVSRSPTGNQVKDAGSHTGISAGNFYLSWSEGGAGARSWIYYRADGPIRFIQQPQQITFESVDEPQFRRYLASRNVREFLVAGKPVQVLGPAVFSGDLPTDAPVSGRVEAAPVRGGVFHLKLSGLATNEHYIIESSYDVKSGNWAPVHSFRADETYFDWSEPVGAEVNALFYRIRQGAY
jgi:hypothetical protein